MAISKERKEALVSQYKDLLQNSSGTILTTYAGLTVKELERLRNQVREVGGEYHIVKNRLALLAIQEVEAPLPETLFDGPIAMGFASEDVIGLAKAIVDLSKDNESLSIKGGVIDGVLYQAASIQRLAELPPLPVVQAQLLGLLQTPATKLGSAIAGSVRQIVNVFNAYAEASAH